MRYRVTEKKITTKGYALWLYCVGEFPCTKDDWDRISVGDEIELLITVIAPEPVAA